MEFIKLFYLLVSPFLAVGAFLSVLTIVALGFLFLATGLTIMKKSSFLPTGAGWLQVRSLAHNARQRLQFLENRCRKS